jgi:hypothetical protein
VVELELDTTPIRGRISTPPDPAREFRGWLELASAIEQLRTAVPATDQARVDRRLTDPDPRPEH